jgi:muramidase (phage lysozyme)
VATPKTITAFKYRTEVIADITKHTSEFKKADTTVEKYGKTIQKVGKETAKAFDGVSVGKKFGSDIGTSAVAALGSSFNLSTLGSLIGTAVAPGIGTTIGSAIGGGIDTALSTVAPIILNQISSGIALNKLIEDTRVEYTKLTGTKQEADKYIADLLGISKDIGQAPQRVIDLSETVSDLTGNLGLTRKILEAASDQAADFGKEGTFEKVAEALGLIAEKGELGSKELKKLYRVGIDAKKYLSEATGLKEKQIEQLMREGRIRGDVAARLIAEGIERDKGGLAAYKTSQTVSGRERQFGVLSQLRVAEGTQNVTRGIGDFYEQANRILDSPQAKKVVDYIDKLSGTLLDFTEKSLKIGVSVGGGIAEGLINFSPTSMMQSFTKLGGFVETGLKTVFEIKSPSGRSAREIGEPIGEGIGLGAVRGLRSFIQGQGGEDIAATIRELLKDPRVQALLDTLAKAEGGGINVMAGGRRVNSGALHPGQIVPKSQWFKGDRGRSSASGLYQETLTNWLKAESVFGPLNFSNLEDQKLVALWLMVSHQGGLQTLKSGNVDQMMALTAKDWTSTPGSTIGGGRQKSRQQWMGYYNQALANGASISEATPVPVYFVGSADARGGAAAVFGNHSSRASTASRFGAAGVFDKPTQDLKEFTLVLGEADGAVVDVKVQMEELVTDALGPGTAAFNQMMNAQPLMRPITQLNDAQKEHAATSIALTKEYQKASREQLIVGMSVLDQLSSAIGQVSGMMPQQQVGKKRGFLSKLLGVAAPFLSFIPGVGPILSQIAGMASNAAAGNWGGVVTGLASGLSPGGVFRGSGAPSAPTRTGPGVGAGLPPRAAGGPGIRGRAYWTGENGPEPFIAPANGYFLNHRDAMSAMGGGGASDQHIAALDRLNSFLARLEGMRPHDVVRFGARGLIDAYDQDASLIRLSSQRHRLA